MQAGIDKLSPDLRTCVILRDIEELSYQEIVDLLQIPEGTVKSRLSRALLELRLFVLVLRGSPLADAARACGITTAVACERLTAVMPVWPDIRVSIS